MKEIALIALFAAVLFVQQLALSMIPNFSFTTLLLIIYTKLLGFRKTSLIIVVHVLVYNILSPFGPVIPLHIPSMLIGWLLIPILLTTILKSWESVHRLAIFGFFFGFLYGWVFIPVSVFVSGTPFLAYLFMDLPFEFVMAVTNFLGILWLYEPLMKILRVQLYKFRQATQ
jgi:hypothetical protein